MDSMHMLKNNNNRHHELIGKADQMYQSGLCDASVDLLLTGIKQYPGERSLYYALAEILIDSEQYQNALDILNEQPSHGRDPRTLELLGYCKFGLGLFEAAETIVGQVLDADKKSAPALNLKGLLALKQSNKNAAEQFFRKAIAVNPEYGEPYTHLGTLSSENSNASEAMDFYEKGFLLTPAATHSVLSYHSAVQAQNAYHRAEPIFKKALEQYPLNKRLIYLLIDIFLQQSKFDMAMQTIERAIVTFGIEDGILEAALNVRDRLGPLEIDANANQKGLVSLCMITKNEEKHLSKCLWSTKPIVDELIVIDTDSTDLTKDIAKAFGAQVFDFKWVDDFSKARNFSIAKASGNWIFILDADEVISSLDYERFKMIVNNGTRRPSAYSIVTRNYTMQANTIGWVANDGNYSEEEAGAGWFPSQKVRLFKNDPRIRFEYPVHEMVDPALQRLGIPIEKFSIPVHHYGKINQGVSGRKTENYFAIGRKKLDEMGGNIVAIRELAIQAGHLEKHEAAIELWQRFIEHQPDEAEAYVNMGTACFNLGKYDQAAISAQKAMALAPDMKEAHFNYAISELHRGNARDAIAVLESILKQYPRYPAAKFMLAAAYCCDGQKHKALAEFEKIRRTDVGPVLAVTFCDLAKRLSGANQQAYAVVLLETAVSSNMANDRLTRLLNQLRQTNQNPP
jgi:tetratricopeptide (TPR) repeat protein